jgi:sn-glycerol 3-phosphate transport system permease protein
MNRPTRRLAEPWLAVALLAPALILLTVFAFVPTAATLWDSFFREAMPTRTPRFVGLGVYRSVIADPVFWQVARNNLVYAASTITLSTAIAFGMALWANAKIPGRALVRLAYFTPTVLPMIAAANLWLYFYTPDIGVFDRVGGWFGMGRINWLGEPGTALWAVTAVAVWKEAGFFMIFYLAALQTIPADLREAARIEGAGRFTYVRRVVWPLLMPTTLFIVVNALINSVSLIDHLFILTRGGPDNASKLLLYWVWENAFTYFDQASAAALTVIILLVLALAAILQMRWAERRTNYQ